MKYIILSVCISLSACQCRAEQSSDTDWKNCLYREMLGMKGACHYKEWT